MLDTAKSRIYGTFLWSVLSVVKLFFKCYLQIPDITPHFIKPGAAEEGQRITT